MSFDETFDLTAGVYSYFYNIVSHPLRNKKLAAGIFEVILLNKKPGLGQISISISYYIGVLYYLLYL